MSVRSDLNRPEIADEFFGVLHPKVRRAVRRTRGPNENQQMIRRRAVTIDRLHGRSQDLFVMAQPTILQLGNRQRLEAQCRRGADFQLGVDLGGQLPGGLSVKSDTRPVPDSVFVIGEIPDFPTRNERFLPFMIPRSENSPATKRNKRRHKRESLRKSQKGKGPRANKLWLMGPQEGGEKGNRTQSVRGIPYDCKRLLRHQDAGHSPSYRDAAQSELTKIGSMKKLDPFRK